MKLTLRQHEFYPFQYVSVLSTYVLESWVSSRNFFRGGEAKYIVMQISILMLLFSDLISGRTKRFQGGKLPQGGQTASGGAPAPSPPPPMEESQNQLQSSFGK